MDTTWRVRDVDDTAVGRLAGALGVREVTARCLYARGITEPDHARNYLAPRLGSLRKPDGTIDHTLVTFLVHEGRLLERYLPKPGEEERLLADVIALAAGETRGGAAEAAPR